MVEERIIRNINENTDSLEFGSPTKGGKVKVYGDFQKKEEFKVRIECAIECMSYAQSELGKK